MAMNSFLLTALLCCNLIHGVLNQQEDLMHNNTQTTTRGSTESQEEIIKQLCSLYNGDDTECQIIFYLRRIVSSISFISTLFMIFIIWLFRRYAEFTQRLLLYLAIAELFHSLSYLINELREHGSTCTFQGWMLQYTSWGSLMWICCLTFNLYMHAVWRTSTHKYEWRYHLVCWGLPFLTATIPAAADAYGPAGLWCSIAAHTAWSFGIWYGPVIVIGLIFLIVYPYTLWIIHILCRQAEAGTLDQDNQQTAVWYPSEMKDLMVYPAVYFIVLLFPMVHRIQSSVNDVHVFALVFLHDLCSPLYGLICAIIYTLHKDTAKRLTPPQMKMAFLQHFESSSKQLVKDTNTNVDLNDMEQDKHKINNKSVNSSDHSHI